MILHYEIDVINATQKRNIVYQDITLADFWGIESVLPEMDDDKGTSLVIINLY